MRVLSTQYTEYGKYQATVMIRNMKNCPFWASAEEVGLYGRKISNNTVSLAKYFLDKIDEGVRSWMVVKLLMFWSNVCELK